MNSFKIPNLPLPLSKSNEAIQSNFLDAMPTHLAGQESGLGMHNISQKNDTPTQTDTQNGLNIINVSEIKTENLRMESDQDIKYKEACDNPRCTLLQKVCFSYVK